jgi:hypothetical protein
MSVIGSNILAGASGQGGYFLTNSLRFRSSAGAYLNRTFSSGDQQKFTLSLWVKRGRSGINRIFTCGSSGSSYFQFRFNSDDTILVSSENPSLLLNLGTSQVFRDYSAWYHLVLAVDTTQATASNRVRLYVNGTEVTAFASATYPSQNTNLLVNSNIAHYIGELSYALTNGYDGYMTEIHFVNAQQLTPSSFGETSASTGVWIPKKYTGTYGTNGFYLDFEDTSSTAALGYDAAGSNDWTVNNISLTAGSTYDSMTDVPTLTSTTAANYATLNPLFSYTGLMPTSGNLSYIANSGNWRTSTSTISVTSGKWYCEFLVSGLSGGGTAFGIVGSTDGPTIQAIISTDNTVIGRSGQVGYAYLFNGDKYTGGSSSAYGASYTSNDVIGVALDLDAGTLVFYKNGVSQGTAFSSLSGTFAFACSVYSTVTVFANFGQQPFAYTPPTGFVALNTFNLPTPTIGATAATTANKYMDATLFTAIASTNTIVNAGGFQPDLVWIKSRNNPQNHYLVDSVRGGTSLLQPNITNAESIYSTPAWIISFNSNGFTSSTDSLLSTSYTYVGWQWRASNATAVTNTAGSITSTVSANTTAGFSIVTYTGTGANATVGHGLGVAPSMVIYKRRSASDGWAVYFSSIGATNNLVLQSTAAQQANGNVYWNSTAPTSTVFTAGTDSAVNASTATYVAYCFAQIAGYSAFGSYTGNGSSDGPFIFTGFRPRFVMFKGSSIASNWCMLDSSRNTYNLTDATLQANDSAAELTNLSDVDFLSNGIKIRDVVTNDTNVSGETYIYMVFAENPFKYANAR